MRGYRDRDFLWTKEDFIFCVLGSAHPEDRIMAYLKYVPDPNGRWGHSDRRFRRILRYYTMSDLLGTFTFLEDYPQYLYDSTVWGIKMTAVPLNRIAVHLKPEEKLSQLLERKKRDPLQQKAVDLVSLISDVSGVPVDFFGVTGSILLDIHREFSDIDLIIYGAVNSRLVKETMIQKLSEKRSPIRRFDEEQIMKWCVEKAERFPLTPEEALAIYKKKWGRGWFRGTFFSVHPVKLEAELSERYGDRIYKPEGMVKVKATVSDASEADFMPALYQVRNVKVLEGKRTDDIREVASYEGLYGGISEEGGEILVYGKLEHVSDMRLGTEYRRVLVGSKEAGGKDYIKPLQ